MRNKTDFLNELQIKEVALFQQNMLIKNAGKMNYTPFLKFNIRLVIFGHDFDMPVAHFEK